MTQTSGSASSAPTSSPTGPQAHGVFADARPRRRAGPGGLLPRAVRLADGRRVRRRPHLAGQRGHLRAERGQPARPPAGPADPAGRRPGRPAQPGRAVPAIERSTRLPAAGSPSTSPPRGSPSSGSPCSAAPVWRPAATTRSSPPGRPRGGGSCWPTAQFEATLLNAGHEARAVRAGAHVLGVVSDVVRPYLGTVLATRADVDTPALRALLAAWDDAERAVLAPENRADVLALLGAAAGHRRRDRRADVRDPARPAARPVRRRGGGPGRVRGGSAAAGRPGRLRGRPRPRRAVPPGGGLLRREHDADPGRRDRPPARAPARAAGGQHGQLARPVRRRADAAGDRGEPAHLGRPRRPSPPASTSSATACCSRCGASSSARLGTIRTLQVALLGAAAAGAAVRAVAGRRAARRAARHRRRLLRRRGARRRWSTSARPCRSSGGSSR